MPPSPSEHEIMRPDGKFGHSKTSIARGSHIHVHEWEQSSSNEHGEVWEYCKICGKEKEQSRRSEISTYNNIGGKSGGDTGINPKKSVLIGLSFLTIAFLMSLGIYFLWDDYYAQFLKFGLFIGILMVTPFGILMIARRGKE
jgi:hypothetical protein